MSTENQSVVGNATCPLCNDYEGQPSSVEAHISRMTDLRHQGEVGRAHRDDIERQADADDGDDGDESDEEAVEDAQEDAGEGEADPRNGWDAPTLDVPDGADADDSDDEDGGDEDDAADADGASTSGGVPMPSTEVLVVGAVVLVAVLYWRSRSSSSASTSTRKQQSEEENRNRQTMGGLN